MSAWTPSHYRFFLPALAFSTVLIVGYGSDLLLLKHPRWMVSDDLILGSAAAIVVFHYEKQRFRFIAEKLSIVREISAFIRNELQILYASLEQTEKVRVQTIERAVQKIDWALRELLPGKITANSAFSRSDSLPSRDSVSRSDVK